ncbi:hypothetical protein HZH66_007593 [Vespula vulgaris]|uniref:Uncharacterized protein n=1 Tax=Vespula vulgaris TaxID=7454 RepID=A0A834K053_VESVU|nr:hypothetical protein HZH66_007593 [Vespula vulgaris]
MPFDETFKDVVKIEEKEYLEKEKKNAPFQRLSLTTLLSHLANVIRSSVIQHGLNLGLERELQTKEDVKDDG